MLCRRWVVTLFLACCSAFAIFFYVFHGIFDIRSRVCELYTQRSHQNCSGGRPPTDFRQTIPVPGSGHSRLTEEFEGLFWFVQITDIHISVHDGLSRAEDLRKFCRSRIPVIKPDLVIASGDLSDSKTADKYDSFQYRTEWELYRAAIRDSGVLNITHWLDIRGNHDAFDVPGLDHEENYFNLTNFPPLLNIHFLRGRFV
ncbi:unnamed protein product [Calicophoron daubneyi]|uniref:Calcineurin-like phosphoesterase domain-containing protein n=1 Tax=Calicophoron daubneyi TaxID=300641 RepID=A0AAV2T4Z5_CALDB